MPINVQLLGIDEPVTAMFAIANAVVFRDDDVEDKLAAAPDEGSYSPAEIASAIALQE